LDVEYVLLWGKGVGGVINREGHVWVLIELGAVWLSGNTLDQWVDDLLWSDQEGSSGVDDSLVLGGINLLVTTGNAGKLKSPVLLLDDLMGVDGLVEFRVHTWDGHVAISRSIMEIERETLVSEVAKVDEGIEVIN